MFCDCLPFILVSYCHVSVLIDKLNAVTLSPNPDALHRFMLIEVHQLMFSVG